MTKTVRVRFAPSPSGYLHVGGARTALFNWLFARHHGGTFILRVENTDEKRSSENSIEAIKEAMRWLKMDWDEGPDVGGPAGPYLQSERASLYQAAAEQLAASGQAYPCYCSEEELKGVREEQEKTGKPVRYDGRCRALTPSRREEFEREGRKPALRFKMPEETITVPDAVKGPIAFDAALYGDLVIVRSNGQAMYNFACVVDDAAMEITHVIRGDEHLANTPKQMLLYRALGLQQPVFAHLPMILGKDREKLSKRHGHTSVGEYEKAGYLPEALVNYLGLLGWSSGDDQEVFQIPGLIARFTLEGCAKSPAIFDGTKLGWLNQQHLKTQAKGSLVALARPFLQQAFGRVLPRPDVDEAGLDEMLHLVVENLVVVTDVASQMKVFYDERVDPDESALASLRAHQKARELLSALRDGLASVSAWTQEARKDVVKGLGKALALKGKDLFHPIRIGATGYQQGVDLVSIIRLLGREKVLENIDDVTRRMGSLP
ncbi:MAG: glutamate--tRNA ligase [Candidatus Riflebacteria bacterium]|nr:glutamate--tRNA ligase [Candidatus Riflebacteria bacterium]